MNWAVAWQMPDGKYLIESNPVRGFPIPSEKNPRRPVATLDRVKAIMEVADQVTMSVKVDGEWVETRSYLKEVFTLAVETGRRISAICQLRWSHVDLEGGTITWPADTDKEGKEWQAPVSDLLWEALKQMRRERPPFRPDSYLFPSPVDAGKAVRYETASTWVREAEKRAGVEPHEGSLWHAYRRMWATLRKGYPVQDVAQAGGWRDISTVQSIYQQADPQTLRRVVNTPTHRLEDVR